jgi:replicative DNA helicase
MIQQYPRRKDNYKLITTNKISFSHKDINLDPYFLGLWLGDGHADAPSITSKDSEILEYLE